MAEHHRPPKNRGFYLKMKFLPKHTRPPPEKSCFFRYYKWLLWLSLSLYFFSSCFISNNNPPSDSDSSHKSQSTLLQSTNITALNPSGATHIDQDSRASASGYSAENNDGRSREVIGDRR